MRLSPLAFILILLPANAAAQAPDTTGRDDPDRPVEGGNLPPGWSARTDAGRGLENVKFVIMEPGYHVTLGPATILYRESDRARGPFHTLATIHQTAKPEHPEGYGLFFGGQNLKGPNQRYTYFLIREDGSYLVKRREGEKTTDLSKGWTPHSAVKKSDPEGKSTNLLEIEAKKDPSKVEFKVNGQVVHTARARDLDLTGIVGLRVNHNLDVHVEGFAVH